MEKRIEQLIARSSASFPTLYHSLFRPQINDKKSDFEEIDLKNICHNDNSAVICDAAARLSLLVKRPFLVLIALKSGQLAAYGVAVRLARRQREA